MKLSVIFLQPNLSSHCCVSCLLCILSSVHHNVSLVSTVWSPGLYPVSSVSQPFCPGAHLTLTLTASVAPVTRWSLSLSLSAPAPTHGPPPPLPQCSRPGSSAQPPCFCLGSILASLRLASLPRALAGSGWWMLGWTRRPWPVATSAWHLHPAREWGERERGSDPGHNNHNQEDCLLLRLGCC